MKNKFKHKDHNKLMNQIRDYIMTTEETFLKKEEVAKLFNTQEKQIEQCFQGLNIEGLLSQPEKKSIQDCTWEPGWRPDIYYIRKNTSQQEIAGKLFLVSVENAMKLKDSIVKLLIDLPGILNLEKLNWKPIYQLMPPKDLNNNYRLSKINYRQFYSSYKREVIYNPNNVFELSSIFNQLKGGTNIAFITHSKSSQEDHRKILGEYFSRQGVEIVNWDKDEGNYSGHYNSKNMFIHDYLNPEWNSKIFDTLYYGDLLHEIERGCYYKDREHIMNFTPKQIRILIDKTIQHNNIRMMNILLEKYNDKIPLNLKDKMNSIVVMNKLS